MRSSRSASVVLPSQYASRRGAATPFWLGWREATAAVGRTVAGVTHTPQDYAPGGRACDAGLGTNYANPVLIWRG